MCQYKIFYNIMKNVKIWDKVCIYKIYCLDESKKDFYIGSTSNLNSRMSYHRYNSQYLTKNTKFYNYIKDNGGWNNFNYEVLEVFDNCDSKKKIQIEREFYEKLKPTLNTNKVGRTQKEYRDDNKEKLTNYTNDYNKKNRERINKRNRENYNKYKSTRQVYHKKYNEAHKEQIKSLQSYQLTCLCGCKVQRSYLRRHLKSGKHIYNLKKVFDNYKNGIFDNSTHKSKSESVGSDCKT